MSGTEEEVLDAAVQHAVSAHGHKNSPELRDQIKSMLKDEADWVSGKFLGEMRTAPAALATEACCPRVLS